MPAQMSRLTIIVFVMFMIAMSVAKSSPKSSSPETLKSPKIGLITKIQFDRICPVEKTNGKRSVIDSPDVDYIENEIKDKIRDQETDKINGEEKDECQTVSTQLSSATHTAQRTIGKQISQISHLSKDIFQRMVTALEEIEFFSVSSHTEAPNKNEKVLSVTVFWINEDKQEQSHIVHFFNFRLSTNFKLLENLINEFESSVVWYDAPQSAGELTQITYSTIKIDSLRPRTFDVLKKYTFFVNGDVLLQQPRLFAQRNESESGIKEYHGSVMERDCPHHRRGEEGSDDDDDDDEKSEHHRGDHGQHGNNGDDDTKSDVAKEIHAPQKPDEIKDIKAPHHGGDDDDEKSEQHGGDHGQHRGNSGQHRGNSGQHRGNSGQHRGNSGQNGQGHHGAQKRHFQRGDRGHHSETGSNDAAILKPVGEHNPVLKIAESIVEQKLVQSLDDEYGVPSNVGDIAHVIGIVWNSTVSNQIEYKLIFVYNREEVPETLMTLEIEIKELVDSVNWQFPPIHWKYVFFGISVTCVFLSVVCIFLIHTICCSKKKQREITDEGKKPILVFKV